MADQLPRRTFSLRRESARPSVPTSYLRRESSQQSTLHRGTPQRHSSQTPSVQNIVIPANLLQTVKASEEDQTWQPNQAQETFSNPPALIHQIAYTQTREIQSDLHRAATITGSTLARSRSNRSDIVATRFPINPQRPEVRHASLPVSSRDVPSWGSDASTLDGRGKDPSVFKHDFSFDASRSPMYRTSSEDHADPLSEISTNSSWRVTQTMTWGGETQPDLERAETSQFERRGTFAAIQTAARNTLDLVRRSSIFDVYEKAKVRGVKLQRKKWAQVLFEYSFYAILLAFVYFVLIGMPLWNGAVWWLWWVVQHKFVIAGGFSITVGLAAFYAFSPLLVLFEPDPPMPDYPPGYDLTQVPFVRDTALLIPCYKSAGIIGNTLEAALRIFPARNIFVVANGNSPTPLDNTEEVCRPYGVNHVWSPVGSKLVAQFVGCYACKEFKYVLMIDDDCALPPNFPVVADRMSDKVKCIGYTIKSVGPNSSRGTLCQQAQDLEYKISGLQRAFAGKIGSATFAHGAIAMWETEFAIKTFHQHPGFSVSEDWFFGHVARQLGSRIKMCTSIFVETETPGAVFISSGGSRGGFGEMTVFKQRFLRWNFFFVNGLWYDLSYIFANWRLGWWEIGAKLFVFQEIYETLLYLLTPFMLPISFIVRPDFCAYLLAGTVILYLANVVIFNEFHLRRKRENCGFVVTYLYYMPYKVILTFVNVASCYWSLYKYARYFAQRHPKVIEDVKAVEVVLRLEEHTPEQTLQQQKAEEGGGRRMTVTAIGTRMSTSSIRTALAGQQQQHYRHSSVIAMGEGLPIDSQLAERLGLANPEQRVEAMDFANMAPIQEVTPRARLRPSYRTPQGFLAGEAQEVSTPGSDIMMEYMWTDVKDYSTRKSGEHSGSPGRPSLEKNPGSHGRFSFEKVRLSRPSLENLARHSSRTSTESRRNGPQLWKKGENTIWEDDDWKSDGGKSSASSHA